MFSSGLPVLYITGFIFFTVLYWVYKMLLLKYYQTTSRFNEKLPEVALHFFKFGVFFHVLMGLFMYTNSAIVNSDQMDNELEGKLDQVLGFLR